jgi:short-subunit dehydrogenase
MNLEINQKNALITGGANGIGKSISEHLANEGVNIYFTSRSIQIIIKIKKNLKKYKVKSKGIKIDFLNKNC